MTVWGGKKAIFIRCHQLIDLSAKVLGPHSPAVGAPIPRSKGRKQHQSMAIENDRRSQCFVRKGNIGSLDFRPKQDLSSLPLYCCLISPTNSSKPSKKRAIAF